jgi:hypothetical protein
MLRTLVNSKTEEYQAFKKLVLSTDYFWKYFGDATNGLPVPEGFAPIIVYYTDLLFRPDAAHDLKGYPLPMSPHVDSAAKIIREILEENNVKLNCILRIATNCVNAVEEVVKSPPHVDHFFDHKNFIIYLNDSSGDTFVEGERSTFKEDKAIFFSGEHYHETPVKGRRIVLVATFI